MKKAKVSQILIGLIILSLCLVACKKDNEVIEVDGEIIENAYTLAPAEEIEVGNKFSTTLSQNITTGYSWQYAIEDETVLGLVSEKDVLDVKQNEGETGIVGSGSQHTWDFIGLKSGTSKIIFKYLRSWEVENPPAKTIEYSITVN